MNEQKKYKVIKKLVETGGNKDRAAVELGVTRRQINRMIKGYKDQGKEFFVHGNRGRQPATTIPPEMRLRIMRLYNKKYWDANFTHFCELLKRIEGINVSVGTIHNILEAEYILSPKVNKSKQKRIAKKLKQEKQSALPVKQKEIQQNIVAVEDAHSRKPRKAFFGEQEQLDASPYLWFGDTITHLHISVDDCTGIITAAFFDTQETLNGYYHLFQQILKTYGIPYSFFTDRRTGFEFRKKGVNSLENDACTQFGYACKQLGVQLDSSSVPQSKARVERMFQSLQSRLPVELRLAGITEIDAAKRLIDPVTVKRNHGTKFHAIHLAAAASQHAAHKASVVFCDIPLHPAHFGVFLRRLRCADGHLKPRFQIIVAYGFVHPFFRLTVIPIGDGKFSHTSSTS